MLFLVSFQNRGAQLTGIWNPAYEFAEGVKIIVKKTTSLNSGSRDAASLHAVRNDRKRAIQSQCIML